MAHTKAKGSSKNNRDSQSKRLGVKLYGGQIVKKGMIIVRQRGSKYFTGDGVMVGSDDTIFAVKDGEVQFTEKKVVNFAGNRALKTFVSVK
ncbi:MAG: 50S ribosomal protein L27 [Candidatus Berkelbacteria bacterium]|nr:50S ribosomal protein L27 [Candidatus Berkelbacteria bacterium]